MLIDARHGLKDSDRTMMQLLDRAAVPYRIILTKADKLKRGQAAAVLNRVRQALGDRATVQLFSALKRDGQDEARQALERMLSA